MGPQRGRDEAIYPPCCTYSNILVTASMSAGGAGDVRLLLRPRRLPLRPGRGWRRTSSGRRRPRRPRRGGAAGGRRRRRPRGRGEGRGNAAADRSGSSGSPGNSRRPRGGQDAVAAGRRTRTRRTRRSWSAGGLKKQRMAICTFFGVHLVQIGSGSPPKGRKRYISLGEGDPPFQIPQEWKGGGG